MANAIGNVDTDDLCNHNHLGHHAGDHLQNNSHNHHHAVQCPARKEMNANDLQTWGDNIFDTVLSAHATTMYDKVHYIVQPEQMKTVCCTVQIGGI